VKKWWLVFALAMAGALWWRFHDRGDDVALPTPVGPVAPGTPVTAEPPVAVAPAPVPPTERPEQPEQPAPSPDAAARDPFPVGWDLHALSADGARALLVHGADPITELRIVDIATGSATADLAIHSVAAMPVVYDAAFATELASVRALLRGFPFGATWDLAATPDGITAAVQDVDNLVIVRGDGSGVPVTGSLAQYQPLAIDNDTLFVRSYHGHMGDDGVYELAWLSLAHPAVHPIPDTIDISYLRRRSTDGASLRVVVDVPVDPTDQHCLVAVSLAKPFKVTARRCASHVAKYTIALSPHGDHMAWHPAGGDPTVGTLDLATGDVHLARMLDGELQITDAGRVLAESQQGTQLFTPGVDAGTPVQLPDLLHNCLLRGEHELVCLRDGSVTVVPLP
jgi:hypothetical protein